MSNICCLLHTETIIGHFQPTDWRWVQCCCWVHRHTPCYQNQILQPLVCLTWKLARFIITIWHFKSIYIQNVRKLKKKKYLNPSYSQRFTLLLNTEGREEKWALPKLCICSVWVHCRPWACQQFPIIAVNQGCFHKTRITGTSTFLGHINKSTSCTNS